MLIQAIHSLKRTLTASAVVLSAAGLGACGGGGDAALDALAAGGGTFTGDISLVAGSYQVTVDDFTQTDCLDNDGGVLPTGGTITATWDAGTRVCSITQNPTAGPVFTERRKAVLPPGNYTLTVSSTGLIEIGNGATLKYKLACPSGGVCRVDSPVLSNVVVTVGGAVGGPGAVSVTVSQMIVNASVRPKVVIAGVFYGLTATADTPVLGDGISGFIAFSDATAP